MKYQKLFVSLVITLSFVLMSFTGAQASGPAGSWSSGIACQNLDTQNTAIVTLTFYNTDSTTPVATYTDDNGIPAGGSRNWLTTSAVSMPNFPPGFAGSGVVSSSTPLACNVNTQSAGVGTQDNPYRMGTGSALSDTQTASTVYVAQAIKNAGGFNSYIAVQNTSTSDVTVKVHYYLTDGSEVTAAAETGVVKGLSNKVFYQSDNANLPTGFNGSAKVESTTPATTKLAVLVAIYKDATAYYRTQFYSYNGVGAGANKVFVPRFVRKLSGNNGGLSIQNVSTTASKITAVFNFNGQSYTVQSPTEIAPGAAWQLYAPNIAALAAVEQAQGSAIITADNPAATIIASVNEDNNDQTAGNRFGQGATYNAILDGQQSKTVFFAQFTKNVANNTFSSGFQISNTTGTPGTCDITYVGQTSPNINETGVPLAAFGSFTRWSLSAATPSMQSMNNGYNAAVKVTCTVDVTGIVNMSAYGAKYGDSFTQTTGLNQ